jgi:hypothetical protein
VVFRLAVVAAVVAVAVVSVVAVLRGDRQLDRQRTMFDDASEIAALESGYVKQHGPPALAVQVPPGGSVAVGGRRFTASPGNAVRVTVSGRTFCVRVTNPSIQQTPVWYDSAEYPLGFANKPGGACG